MRKNLSFATGRRPARGRRSVRVPRAAEPPAPLVDSAGLNAALHVETKAIFIFIHRNR